MIIRYRKLKLLKYKIKVTFGTSFMLMFLGLLLLFELFFLPFLYLKVRLPSLFPMKSSISIRIHAISHFRQTVIPTIRAEFDFIFGDFILLPTEITFPNESSDRRYHSTVHCDEFYTQLGAYVLDCVVSTN